MFARVLCIHVCISPYVCYVTYVCIHERTYVSMHVFMYVTVQVKVQRFSIKEINPMGRLRGRVHAIHASHPAIVCNKVVALSLVGLRAARSTLNEG